MTDKELSQYRKLIHEVGDLQVKIDKLYDKDIDTSHSTVRGSSKSFPFTEFHFGVWVDDPEQVASRDKLIAVYKDRIKHVMNETVRIEQFIKDIPDSELRQIFEYRYIDGLKLREIGELINRDWSGIGKKIRDYLNFPTIPQNQ